MIDDVLIRFRELRRRFGHAPTGRGKRTDSKEYRDVVNEYRLAQLEMYNLAQVICFFHENHLQLELDSSRRDIMEVFRKQIEQSKTENFPGQVMVLTKRYRPTRWEDHILTPELTFSPEITGLAVPQGLVDRIKRAHRMQVQVVNSLTLPKK